MTPSRPPLQPLAAAKVEYVLPPAGDIKSVDDVAPATTVGDGLNKLLTCRSEIKTANGQFADLQAWYLSHSEGKQ